jgi:two-component system, OmpR family, sensor kinase
MTTDSSAALIGTPPPARRWRVSPHSLTGRLVVGVVSLVVVLVLAIGIGTYFALESFLYDRLDQQVGSTAGGAVNRVIDQLQASPAPGIRAPQDVWVVVVSHDGTVVVRPVGGSAEVLNLAAADRVRLAGRSSDKPVTIHTTDGHVLRVTVRQGTLTTAVSSVPVAAIVGLSTEDVDNTLHRLIVLEWIIGGSAVLLALVATSYGVRFSLRRLRGVTQTAREVTAELSPSGAGLDRRVPVSEADDGTEVGQLADSMNTLLSTVETQFAARVASEERMRQFLADASHELRTPLTSIRGYAELARMQREQRGAAADPANLERIEAEGTRMSRLVDDLLTLARSDQGGGLQLESVDVSELLDEAVTGARAAYPGRRIDVSAPPGQHLRGDHDQLLRVVRNLVANAAVHTRPDGPIGVSAVADGDAVLIRVSDSGPGLPAEDAAHVFERFWRADQARTRARGGSGLGLAIVASIVQAHGGSVRFDSTVERGSTVTVRLPIGMP